MLVLSRKPSERIWIGSDICIEVVRIGQCNVRLAIDAPRDLNVVRQELLPIGPDGKIDFAGHVEGAEDGKLQTRIDQQERD